MNSKFFSPLIAAGIGAGVLLCTAGRADAQTSNSVVTFSVDMTGHANFVLGTDQIGVRGTFNGYGIYFLTNNPTGANSNLFSGTVTDTADPNGGQMQFKFWNSDAAEANGGWESPANGNNRLALLPATSGASLVLPTIFFSDDGPATNCNLTFEVDMAQQINKGSFVPGTDTVEVQGGFEGWSGGDTLTNDPTILRTNSFGLVTSNVYVGTFGASASPGAQVDFKFVIQPAGDYESPSSVNGDPYNSGNRYRFLVSDTNPVVFFSDAPYAPIATNAVTFQVDMSAQLFGGAFNPASDSVWVEGGFNNWQNGASGNQLTNNPAAANTNIYSGVVVITDGVGASEQYKFTYTGGNVPGGIDWETPGPGTPQIGGNRFFNQPNATATTLPAVFFSDQPPGLQTTVTTPTEVTFSVNMANAVEFGNPGVSFNPSSDSVYLNGDFIGWGAWNVTTLASYQLTNNPVGSSNYSLTVLIPSGNSLVLTYKYGMYNVANSGSYSDLDNEAGFAQNHQRYIRTLGNYTLPIDTFGNQFDEPLAFGQLTTGTPSGGTVPISWLGLPGVHLQTATSLGGAWVDHPDTDGATWTNGYTTNDGFISVTNVPAGSSSMFFRLIRPVQTH